MNNPPNPVAVSAKQAQEIECAVRVLESFDTIGQLAWDDLAESCPEATVFQSYEWLTSWWDVFGDESGLRLFAAFDGEQLLAVAPLFLSAENDVTTLRFVGRAHADYNLILWREHYEHSIRVLIKRISELSDARTIELEEVPSESRVADAIVRARMGYCTTGFITPCPRFANSPQNIHRILQKKSIKRKQALIRKLGDIEIGHTSDTRKIESMLPDFFDQHVERWKETAYPSLFENSRNREFYLKLTKVLGASKRLIFTKITVGRNSLAYHFGLISSNDLIWYKPSYNTEFSAHSPGEFLLVELIRYVASNDLAGLDFTRGDEPFKRRFCTEVSTNCDFVWFDSVLCRLRLKIISTLRTLKRKYYKST